METHRARRLFYTSTLAALVLSILAAAPRAEAAFGVSPPFLNADHLVPGSRYTQVIYLVQDQPNEDLRMKAELDIPEKIRSWIRIDKGLSFVIPKGVRQFPVEVTVEVPKEIKLGAWSGNLTFTSAPPKTGQVSIALGAQVIFNLTVGNDVYRKFTVPVVKLLDIEEGWNPRVYVKFQNDGNIPEAFTAATYELSDQFDAARLAYSQKRGDFSETLPFTVKEYTVEFPINFHLGIGQYWGSVTLYQDEKVVGGQKTVFNVLKRGTLEPPTTQFINFIKRKEVYYSGAGVLALILIFSIAKIVKKRNSRQA